jgi:5-methylcytosine-specific restriction endonuclease McrA
MKDLFEFLVNRLKDRSSKVKIEDAISHLGLQGRVLDVRVTQTAARITDDTRSTLYVREAIKKALRCPVCNGLLDPSKSVSYNHIIPKRSGGTGDINNAQMAHPYCNSNKDELLKVVGLKRPKG